MSIDTYYVNHWGKPKPEFTEMELALMEGGHSVSEPAKPHLEFIKSLILVENNSKSLN
jgi:hypothetical protein